MHPVRASRLAVAITAIALSVLTLPVLTGTGSIASAATTAVTQTGPAPAWDPLTSQVLGSLPTVTVSQTASLTDQVVHVSWTNFTPTSNDTNYTGAPTPPVTYRSGSTLYPVQVLQCRGASPAHGPFDNNIAADCYGGADHGAQNVVSTVTNPDGTGSADIHLETAAANDFLGCDVTHPCSIAVVPNWGGKQSAGQTRDCADHSDDFNAPANDYNSLVNADETHLGLECSWDDRFVFPLSFAPTQQDCVAAAPAFSAAGSPMLERAMAQWQGGWCAGDTPLNFGYNSGNNEYQARKNFLNGGSGALTASSDVALVTQPADPLATHTRAFTYAPVATTAIVVAYLADSPSTGAQLSGLRLNARLLAKLLTQSYAPAFYDCSFGGNSGHQSANCDPAVAGNPNSIFSDPEFLALNPQLSAADIPQDQNAVLGAFFPTVVGGDSDLTYELTRWIAADPDASAFLAGKIDPWGMTVNTYYRGISYPTSQFLELDPGYVDPDLIAQYPGNGTMQNSWQPVNSLDKVGALLVSNTATALAKDNPGCLAPCSLPKLSDAPGTRGLFAIMDAAQAAAYAFPTAALVNAQGSAVAPSTASMTAALNGMTVNADAITQRASFTSPDARAYPLTVVNYAMVPTCGLPAPTAAAVGTFLDKVGNSQTYGVGPGQLAPGYQALNAAQLAQTNTAAAAVRKQSGCLSAPTTSAAAPPAPQPTAQSSLPTAPSVPRASSSAPTTAPKSAPAISVGVAKPKAIKTSAVPSQPATSVQPAISPPAAIPVGGRSSGFQGGRVANSNPVAGSGSTSPHPSSVTATSPAPNETPTATPKLASFGVKQADQAGVGGLVLPILLILGAILLLLGPGMYLLTTTSLGLSATRLLTRWTRR